MDLNLIQTFIAAAELQSYTKAADRLGLTQPAVSASIKRLESILGKKLFVKMGRGVALTSTAYQLLPQFEQALNIIENAITNKSHFEVCCSEALLHILPEINTAKFYESPAEKYILFELLKQQKMDLVIDIVTTKNSSFMDSPFIVEDAYSEEAVVICRKKHPRIQNTLSKEQFYNESHCLFSGRWNDLSGFEQLALENIQERKVSFTTTSFSGMALYVAQQDCLGIIPKSFAMKWGETLGLQILPCPISIRKLHYRFVFHKRNIDNPAHLKLRKQIKKSVNTISESI
ncbi:TPA: LysR family transcriptional regulator [Vibrio parahaemolyticus]